jgi:hypothetical protein
MIKLITKTSFGLILFLILVSLNQKLIAQEKQDQEENQSERCFCNEFNHMVKHLSD